MFKPPKDKEILFSDSKQIRKKFIIKRNQILFFASLTYILYYFTRKSFDLSGNKLMQENLMLKEHFALIGMFFAIIYGCSKFIIGNFADRSSSRVVVCFGLIISVIINLALGGVIQIWSGKISIAPLVLMIFLMSLLGLSQGMGWPGTARMFSHWFDDKERTVKIGIWNIGHGLGGSLLPLIIIPLIEILDPESKIFGLYYWIPSCIALLFIPIIIWGLRDRPTSEGLPTIEKWKGIPENIKEKNEINWKEIFTKYVLKNKFIWILACTNIWVYVLRQGISSWSLQIVYDIHDIRLKNSKILWSVFEWSGMIGAILSAYVSRWFFKNCKAPVMIIGLIFTLIGLIMFQLAPLKSMLTLYFSLIISGFGIYIPQSLIGATAIELTNKKAAATAAGFTGLAGYFGDAVMSKILIPQIYNYNNNWTYVFYYFYICILLSIICLVFLLGKNENNKLI
ncbi:hypothetical protein C6B38_02355 [Spiroplasma sp. ChiS]|uniref:MFS transporter n=1 Tax=Spiroplasma sp. ChiS TaxID=2099885 RepID=UPI000CF94C79|nr:MFS transporter [Spiroplasma sp. ChiS]PQP79101.1 hypothetical protein C6B38_02355 [Spiroplasma sp. ChiS]